MDSSFFNGSSTGSCARRRLPGSGRRAFSEAAMGGFGDGDLGSGEVRRCFSIGVRVRGSLGYEEIVEVKKGEEGRR